MQAFEDELSAQVHEFFRHRSCKGDVRLHLKTGLFFLLSMVSYGFLLMRPGGPQEVVILSILFVFGIGGIGFAVAHDANHHAFSKKSWVNQLFSFGYDVLGGSSYLWRWKHNVYHHSHPNVAGWDEDLDMGPLFRVTSSQPLQSFHRFQHLYCWPLYCFLVPAWQFLADTKALWKGKIGEHRYPRPQGTHLQSLVAGKLVFFLWAFVIPLCFHPWENVLAVYALCAGLLGFLMSLIFQLAHCTEKARFRESSDVLVPAERTVHQIDATVNFAPQNSFINWYFGGLNFQIEHHLLPHVSHIHYPALSSIVRSVCVKHGVSYVAHPTLAQAIRDHARFMKRMGKAA